MPKIYKSAGLMLLAAFAFPGFAAAAGTAESINVLHSFTAGTTDGKYPAGGVTIVNNTLFGLTENGGTNNDGTIYQYNLSNGTEKVAYSLLGSFTGPIDAAENSGHNSLTAFGNTLYGSSNEGGSVDIGTSFSYTIGNTSDTLYHSFLANDIDGVYPTGSVLTYGSSLWGATRDGGSAGDGTVYAVNITNNQETLVHAFTGGTTDGSGPTGGMAKINSTFYGLTSAGGPGGFGTIYSVNGVTNAYSSLYSFKGNANNGTDGYSPADQLLASGSVLYGVTTFGGVNGDGTIFEFNPANNTEQTLYSFSGNNVGAYPMGGLVQSGSILYGCTSQDSTGFYYGSVFGFNLATGTMSVLSPLDSGQAVGALALSGNTLYGTTANGGTAGDGQIFSIAVLPVPEPASTGLIAAAVIGLAARRRRR